MNAPAKTDSWIRCPTPHPAARLRLFCLPYAGGGASIFKNWGDALPDSIEVCAIQLPGREDRIAETPFRRVEQLLPVLLDRLRPYLDRRIAFFGHSMGAFLSYELALALTEENRAPAHLIVSGQRAPHLPLSRPESYHLSDTDFCERLRSLNGTPASVLAEPELLSMILPLLRSDFEMSETYQRVPKTRLDCPIQVFGGDRDEEVDRAGLEAWQKTTSAPVKIEILPGDHFFLQSLTDALLEMVERTLRPYQH
jgi:medium-chain acyl-[acyl-carrier-protein] hydrolase